MGLTLGQAMYKQLSATAGLTALTSNRIYPLVAPQGAALPFVVYQQISDPGIHSMLSDPSIRSPRFQVSSFANTYAGARAVAAEVKTALQDYRTPIDGLFGDGTSGIDVQRIFFENEIDMADIDPDTVAATFHLIQDYIVWATT